MPNPICLISSLCDRAQAPTVCKIFLASGTFCSLQCYWNEWTPDTWKTIKWGHPPDVQEAMYFYFIAGVTPELGRSGRAPTLCSWKGLRWFCSPLWLRWAVFLHTEPYHLVCSLVKTTHPEKLATCFQRARLSLSLRQVCIQQDSQDWPINGLETRVLLKILQFTASYWKP